MTYTKTVALPVSPDEAFALLTEPERLRRWQAVSAIVDLRAGGEYRWTVTPGHVGGGTFREVEPGRRIVFGWGWEDSEDLPYDASTVTVTVEPAPEGSLVTLVHEGLSELAGEEPRRGLGPLPRAPRAPGRHRRRGPRRVVRATAGARPLHRRRSRPRRRPARAARPHRRGPAQADPVHRDELPPGRRAPDGVPRRPGDDGRRHRSSPPTPSAGRWRTRSPRWPPRRSPPGAPSTSPAPSSAAAAPSSRLSTPPACCPSSSSCTAGTLPRAAARTLVVSDDVVEYLWGLTEPLMPAGRGAGCVCRRGRRLRKERARWTGSLRTPAAWRSFPFRSCRR